MKKNALIVIIFLGISLPVAWSQQTPATPYEIKATELLRKASNKIKEFQTMEARFTYLMENEYMDISESMNGRLWAQGDKYHMVIGNNVFISDGETVWNYIDELLEIHISYVENTEGGLTPTSLIENFEDEYRGKFIRQENHEGQMVDIIDLVPVTPQSFFKYRLALNARDQMLVYNIAYDRHGGTYTFSIDELKVNHPIQAQKFVFNAEDFPADVDVIDLR